MKINLAVSAGPHPITCHESSLISSESSEPNGIPRGSVWSEDTPSQSTIMSSVLLRGLAKVQDTTTRLLYGKEQVTRKMSFYECIDKDMAGNEVKMSSFAGDVLLLVNVASN